MRIIAAEPQSQSLAERTTALSTETRIQDTTTQSLQQQSQSLLEGQRILRETASSVAGANQQASKAKTGGGGFQGLVEVGIQLADRAATIKGRQQERELKRREALKKQLDAEKEARRQEQLTEAESIANSIALDQRTNGTTTTLEGIRSVINDPKFEDLTAEDRRELERRYQATIREGQKDIIQDVERTTNKLREAKARNVEADLMLQSGQMLNQLRYTTDPTQQSALVDQLMADLATKAVSGGLNLREQLELETAVLEKIGEGLSVSQLESLDINRRREQLSASYAELSAIESAFANGDITDSQRHQLTQDLLARNKTVSREDLYTIEDAQNAALRVGNFTKQMRALAKDEYEFENALPVLENQQVAELALEVLNDPTLKYKYEQFDTADNQRVLETVEYLQGIKEGLANPARRNQLASTNADRTKAEVTLQEIQRLRANPDEYQARKKAGIPTPDISDVGLAAAQAALNEANEKYTLTAHSLRNDLAELEKFGVVYDDATGQLGLNQSVAAERQRIMSLPTTSDSGGGGGGLPTYQGNSFAGLVAPGFNSVGGNNSPTLQPLTKSGGITGKNGKVQMVSAVKDVYKGHFIDDSPVGSYDFTLIDSSNSDITAIPAPVTGRVSSVGFEPGYGHYIGVRDAETGIEWFMGHLNEAPPLQSGQSVVAGQSIGVQGSSGRSTGPHIHLELWEGEYGNGGRQITNRAKTQPLVEAYLNRATSGDWPSTTPNSIGLPPSQSQGIIPQTYSTGRVPTYVPRNNAPPPPGSMPLPGGGYILGGSIYLPSMRPVTNQQSSNGPSTSQFDSNRPLAMPQTSRYRRDYPDKNDPGANYGYASLREDAEFRKALAGTADRLDIPAQWLADIMAFESTQNGIVHNPRAENAEGAVGLIQFYPGGGLAEVAKGMGVSEYEAKQRLLSMSRAQQMKWVENHLNLMLRYAGKTKYERMDDVFAAIFGGPELLAKSDAERMNVSDSAISYAAYRSKIGHHVGRTYTDGRGGRPTHTSHHSSCPVCNQMMQTQGRIIPHQAQ